MDPRISSAEWNKKHQEGLGFDDDDIIAFREKGLALFEAGQAEHARSVFEMLLALGEEDAAVHLVLSGCCHLLEDEAASSEHFSLALALLERSDEQGLLEAALIWGESIRNQP